MKSPNRDTKTAEFVVPTLADVDAEYAALAAKAEELVRAHAATKQDIRALEADLVARPSPSMRSGVAALLGESVDASLLGRVEKLAELRKHLSDVEAAQAIVRRNLADRRGPASMAACKAVRGEYGKRVAVVIDALKAVDAARVYADEIRDELDRNDVALGYLPSASMPWLGDLKDGRIAQYIKEAREAGYVS